jgi:HNH endonuclease
MVFKSFTELQEALSPARLRDGRSMRNIEKLLSLSDSESWRDVLRRDPCAYCGALQGGTIDHITALSVGGPNQTENLAGACATCNTRKSKQSLLAFLAGAA